MRSSSRDICCQYLRVSPWRRSHVSRSKRDILVSVAGVELLGITLRAATQGGCPEPEALPPARAGYPEPEGDSPARAGYVEREAVRQAMAGYLTRCQEVLAALGIERPETVGQQFDPYCHRAVEAIPVAEGSLAGIGVGRRRDPLAQMGSAQMSR